MTAPEADLTGWSSEPFTGAGYSYDVYRRGSGPGVVLIPEMPGIHPGVLALGNHLVDNGFTVAIPSLFGQPGKAKTPGYIVAEISRGCVAKEFAAMATNKQRPVSLFLRALARDLNEKTPGKGVGVIGQCFTGGFALAAAVDDSVLAPVLSQPSVPFPLTAKQRRDPGMSESELAVVADRCANHDLCALGLRFSGDKMAPSERFTTLKQRLGDAFEVIEIDSGPGNEHGFGRMAHSVLTDEVREVDGQPAYEARKRVVEFLTERLT
ncbi:MULTISPECIES: dienelactone hydrolase family protein [Mycobacterium]|uniref:Dienelactone hydrolase n=2 Tax=Mycobacterium TaxID=1763 RepID=A0A1X1WEH6_MYCGO|nr:MULTISPECIES: dienelactone hydrolase family protein [Mycobacterium]EUA19634.1 dienelactone hydrolase family protein [Mycobacterium kansasii 662]MCV7008967.1 dienelactone hydrolase family protein [Mycobacterium gordonae]ODR20072.1 dienelactone hydrolase [Mycobacterium gordonae]ORV84981.1 dienelactone hydrolase [Mycobacterium gordonae]PJE16423.1 MAG: dienelactone hydrolase [Mycobacterium sp.]